MADRLGILRNCNDRHTFTATAEMQPGEVVQVMNKIGIVLGEAVIAIGEEVTVLFDAVVELKKAVLSDTYAVEDEVMLKTKLADTTGTVSAGLCAKASTATDKYVWVALNFAPAA